MTCPFPWAHLDPVVEATSTEGEALVNREGGALVSQLRGLCALARLGQFMLRPMSPYVGGIQGQGLELPLDWPGEALCLQTKILKPGNTAGLGLWLQLSLGCQLTHLCTHLA